MQINIKATNMELTPDITAYVEEKVGSLDKFIVVNDPESVMANVEVGIISQHHQTGDIFRAEINLHIGGEYIRAVAEKEELLLAIDEMKSEAAREITSEKEKKRDMLRKGQAEAKNMLKEVNE